MPRSDRPPGSRRQGLAAVRGSSDVNRPRQNVQPRPDARERSIARQRGWMASRRPRADAAGARARS
eukprot:9089427-Pyramimonas_sp.AAC.1